MSLRDLGKEIDCFKSPPTNKVLLRTKIPRTAIKKKKKSKIKLQIAAAGNAKTLLMGWRSGSRGRRKGSWKEYSGSKFSVTVLAPMPRVARYPSALVVLLLRRVCKTWQQDQRGKPHVSLADARQTQVVGNRGGKKKSEEISAKPLL